ncbi:hypothetical protein NLG97_g7971 [Lecanicillium saksenae]|uniref:Uncharacterized protein n=1 Tax=Lecanicillium saksenae TaxID=468837 RepID=A0ACC1QNI1_9HYPO|nr:hypothetical protein NLG97_g7971 [Lecanicillium saksenae]
MLRAQNEVSWSAVCVGWFAEYILPDPAQRYLTSSGELWPQNYANKTFTIYGDGKQLLNVTSARDAARAAVKLLEYDRHAWEDYTYVSGEQLSWRQLGEFLQKKDSAYSFKKKSLAASVRQYVETTSPEDKIAAMFELWAHSEALHFPMEKVMQHRKKYFSELQFKDLEKLVSEAAAAPGNVI